MMAQVKALRWAVPVLVLTVIVAPAEGAESLGSIRKRLAAASSRIGDLRGTMVVSPASRADAAEISKGVLEFLDYGFREASIAYRRPDKFRAQGKAKGIDVTYILNGNRKQIHAPALMLKKTDDLSDKVARKQSTLDVGFASDTLWRDNSVRLLSCSGGVAKLKLVPRGTDNKRHELVWLDTRTLKVVKRERYGGDGALSVRHIYTNHRTLAGMPVASLVKVYSPDGGYAGSVIYKNIRVNSGIDDSIFAIK